MEKPCLVIMAAGMGSRYGGLKQIDPVDPQGHSIMDFSLFDAREAGFPRVVFIIKREFAEAFQNTIGARTARYMDVDYAFQELSDLPEGFSVPEGRVKPWGTAHALLAARRQISGPFAAINADDYYGKESFRDLYTFLSEPEPEGEVTVHAMSGYRLANTLTENGHVARGICSTDSEGHLTDIVERTRIQWVDGHPAYTLDAGETWTAVPEDTPVSMNLWGFRHSFLTEAETRFSEFLSERLPQDPLTCEYFIPTVVHQLLDEGKAQVQVLRTNAQWYGVTYREDKPAVEAAIASMKAQGLYPEDF